MAIQDVSVIEKALHLNRTYGIILLEFMRGEIYNMGDVDIHVKNFIKINSVFAQLFEKGVYHGAAHIECSQLRELDAANQDTIDYGGGKHKSLERFRDAEKVTMLFADRAAFQIIMGVEGQAGVHYYMPVRCMEMDAVSYSVQCRQVVQKAKEEKKLGKYADGVPKGTKLVPVVTLVFYTGSKPWDGPKSLYDMLDVPENMKGWLLQATPDYQMNLIDARHMTKEQINEFEGDLKAFLLMLQERYDEKQLKTALATHRETWYALSKIKNDKRYAEYIDRVSDEELKGGIYMDATLDYIEKRGEQRGEKRGEQRILELYQLLVRDGRLDEWNQAVQDRDKLKELIREYLGSVEK